MDRSSPAYLVLSVVVTCVVSAAALSATYGVTKERIAEQERAAETRALQAVVPAAASFEAAAPDVVERAGEAAGETPVYAVHRVLDASGETIGWGVQVGPRGYGGPIRMVVGLDRDGKVVGVSIISANETPGLGSKVLVNEEFIGAFVGLESPTIDRGVKGVDAVSGATKSSNGVKKGVAAAGHVFEEVLGEGGTVQ